MFDIEGLMKSHGCKTVDELMEKEKNFNDEEMLKYLNSEEFKNKLKIHKFTEEVKK